MLLGDRRGIDVGADLKIVAFSEISIFSSLSLILLVSV